MSWVLPRFDHFVTYGGASHAGNVRALNEDTWAVEPTLGAFVIADGTGGQGSGRVAAQLAVTHALARLREADAVHAMDAYVAGCSPATRAAVFAALAQAVHRADYAVRAEGDRIPSYKGMGCTLDVLVLCGPNAFLAHVGDARVYLARPAATIQLTGDHTLHGALMARGVTTPSTPPSAGRALTNIVGREQPPHVDEIFLELCPGDRLVLCTDGVYSELRDEAALSAIALSGAPDAAAAALVNAALQNHGRDNATALVIEVCQQRLQRPLGTESSAERDFVQAAQCAILAGLPQQMAAHALQSAIEVRFAPGEPLPRAHANDRVGYILLEGTVTTPRGLSLAVPALIYPESLAGGGHGPELCVAQQYVRAFRIRADDLREVCASNTALAAAIYERLARHLARLST